MCLDAVVAIESAITPFTIYDPYSRAGAFRFPSLALGGAQRAHLPMSTRNMELLVHSTGKGRKGALILVPH